MACDFLLMAMALLLESSPVRLQFQHQHRDKRNNHSRRAAHNGRTLPGLPQNKFRRGGSPALQVVERSVGHP